MDTYYLEPGVLRRTCAVNCISHVKSLTSGIYSGRSRRAAQADMSEVPQ